MRALLSASLALFLALAALAPHVHVGVQGAEECAVCVASGRGAEPTPAASVVAAPAESHAAEPAPAPGIAPVLGAPLGAVPGQSPPRA